jgi:hypothetical protein
VNLNVGAVVSLTITQIFDSGNWLLEAFPAASVAVYTNKYLPITFGSTVSFSPSLLTNGPVALFSPNSY